MRLSSEEIQIIKNILAKFSNGGEVYLHGSRLDDQKKGGDIDLFFVVPDKDFPIINKQKFAISAEVSLALNEQKVDIVYLSKDQAKTQEFFLNSIKALI